MEHSSSKWRRERSESCDEAPAKGGELKKPVSLGPPGSLKKGKTPPVAVTSPITHTAQTLKVAGEIVIEIILLHFLFASHLSAESKQECMTISRALIRPEIFY